MKKFFAPTCAALALLMLTVSCQTVPTEIPDDLDARQLIQLGQDNYDAYHYKASEAYFLAVLDRFGDDPKHYIEAKYELGHLYLKQRKYRAAIDNFNEILEIYDNVPMGLPGSYKILCGIELAKISPEKMKAYEAKEKAKAEAAEKKALKEAQKRAAQEEKERAKQEALLEKEAAAQNKEPAKTDSAAASSPKSADTTSASESAKPAESAAPDKPAAPAEESGASSALQD